MFASLGQIFESGVDDGATAITSLDLPDSSTVSDPTPIPGGDVFWFKRNGGTLAGIYYAVRDGGVWTDHRADLGFAANTVDLGAAAFYAGTIRMPVYRDIRPNNVELSSSNGATWTVTEMVLPDGQAESHESFSADGCLMLLQVSMTGSSKLAVAARGPNGTFGPTTVISQTLTQVEFSVIDPTYRRLWVVDGHQLLEAVAP
jgi:hypothetical protein